MGVEQKDESRIPKSETKISRSQQQVEEWMRQFLTEYEAATRKGRPDRRVEDWKRKVSTQIFWDLSGQKICLGGYGSAGVYWAVPLYLELKKRGEDVTLIFIDKDERPKASLREQKKLIQGRVLVGVDDAVWHGRSLEAFYNTVIPLQETLDIKDIKFAVESVGIDPSSFNRPDIHYYPEKPMPGLLARLRGKLFKTHS